MQENERFPCQFDGCNRSFSRQEHLHRHVLNHADGEFTCDRCRTVFKRPDLLERHMARHRRKDAEGGTLMTRKRLWKDVDGRVVNRPAKEARKFAATTVGQSSSQEPGSYPPSPPKSASDLATSPSSLGAVAVSGDQQSNKGFEGFGVKNYSYTANEDFLWDTSLQPVYDSSYSTGPFDDIFAPDTASSFNMPYTTMSNYNWLFDLNSNPTATLGNFPVDPANTMFTIVNSNSSSALGPQNGSPIAGPQWHYQQSSQPCMARQEIDVDRNEVPSTIRCSSQEESVRMPVKVQKASALKQLQEAPRILLHPDTDLPQIDDMSHERVLDIIETSRPITPDGSLVTVDHPLLSSDSLQGWLDLFFLRFNTVYPLIHMPTFDPSHTESILLLSMVLLGATYADKDAHQLAVCIHDVIRPQIFSNPGFSAKPELWVLQATLLTECLGKSRAGQKQHDMSHLFHGLLINLIRRSDCQSIVPETEKHDEGDVQAAWKAWAMSEQKKRLAQLCFVWDVQHAVLFSQSLCMSAFELRSTLPCAQHMWEAPSAIEWRKAFQHAPNAPLLLTELKRCLTGQSNPSEGVNLLGHVIILHGLISIFWDLTRRDQTSLGLVADKLTSGSWRDRMKQAYDHWKAGFEKYSSTARQNHDRMDTLDHAQRLKVVNGFETYLASYVALYHAAQLILAADILDLQIYAGARHILGRSVSKVDYVRSQKVIKAWANEDTSRAAFGTWHAAQLLQLSLDSKSVSVTGDIFHHPWTLFLANVAVWTFYQASKSCAGNSVDDEMIWDVQDEMKSLLKSMTDSSPSQLTANCKTSTAGLTAVVVKHLSKIRWGVIHDGMLVLRGLVQWRLINDEDSRA
ncbi:hypothetical protein M409DRAFT_63963 [Zasmidium cellare ATCC 36951]|uniref:C2H2-type domain-containing protein n=1 Tax=Zasmidium cellare ATCC 36951 TaxID=1080233 RepID=A0A6A6CUW4_ZASCE|nr:uncharacterized protein M409DRAFT_63963 [Zasmidium cellare ATCC 36951]KAF2170954.1 hypothetical protein M409DRAFT_63963 [Zasmidium cellare ATCC 36951]